MVSQSFTSPRIFLNWGWFTMVRNHRFTLPNCALKLGSITCKANHIYHFNVLFVEKMSTPHPLKCSFLNTLSLWESHFLFMLFHIISFSAILMTLLGWAKRLHASLFKVTPSSSWDFPPDSCYSFRLLRRERNYAKYILIVKYFAPKQSKMTHYWLRSWSLDPEFTALIKSQNTFKLFIWGFESLSEQPWKACMQTTQSTVQEKFLDNLA